MEQTEKQIGYTGEVTLKELILKSQELWREIIKRWWLIMLICIPFVAYFVWKTYSTPPVYNAEVRFLVEGQEGGSLGGLGGLLGSFGISGGSKGMNPHKITNVAKSKLLLSQVLFSKDTQNVFLANRIIEDYKLAERWSKNEPGLKDFSFASDESSSFTFFEQRALKSLIRKVIGSKDEPGEALLGISFDEDLGIFSILSRTVNEEISITLVSEMYDNLQYFFEERNLQDKTKKRNFFIMKSDSLKSVIYSKSLQLARFEDSNRGLVTKEATRLRNKISLEIQGLTTAYIEAVKNFEVADFALKDAKQVFLKIDSPLQPLIPKTESLLRNILMALFIGVSISIFIIVVRTLIKGALED